MIYVDAQSLLDRLF